MSVPAVCTGNLIFVTQMRHHPSGNRLLPNIQVERAWNLAVFHQLTGFFFKAPNPNHARMQVNQGFIRYIFGHSHYPFLMQLNP